MKITIDVPDHFVEEFAARANKPVSEETAEETYQHRLIQEYLYPVNPDGSLETEKNLNQRIYSLLRASYTTIGRLHSPSQAIRTAKDMINISSCAFRINVLELGDKNG